MEKKIEIKNIDGLISINNLTTEHIEALKSSLSPVSNGYKLIKAQSFSQQKATFYSLQPELKALSNSQLRIEIEKQLEFGRVCSEILFVIEESEGDAKVLTIK